MDPVGELESRFIPLLNSTRARLLERFPACRFTVYTHSVGRLTSYQGHSIGLEGLWPKAPRDRTDNVALSIGLSHLTSEPMIVDAGVAWGGDGAHPDVGLELIYEPVPFSDAALADLERDYPRLAKVLEQAVGTWYERSPA